MKKLGRGLHISTATGNIIVKSSFEPKVGSKVFDGERKIGMVFDVFGPVSSPYVSIKPAIKDRENIVNHVFFLREEEKRGRKI